MDYKLLIGKILQRKAEKLNYEKTLLLLFHFLISLELACGTQMLQEWVGLEISIADATNRRKLDRKKKDRKGTSFLNLTAKI